ALRNLIVDDSRVIGVEGEDLETKSAFKKTCKIVVDCTGVTSVLRTNLPINSHIQRKINRDDLEATGRYIYNFDNEVEDNTFFDPDYCIIHLDQNIAPGGYAWVFPKGKNKVNVGLGVQQKEMGEHNKKQGERKDVTKLINDYVKINKAMKNPRLSEDPSDSQNA